LPFGVERQFGDDGEAAPLIVAEKGFVPVRHPLDRPARTARGPGDQRKLRIERIAHAEIAADVVGDDAHGIHRHVETGRKLAPVSHRAAACRVDRVTPARRIELGDRGARLHRRGGDALHPGLEFHDVPGARERFRRRGGVAEFGLQHDVAARFIPDRRTAIADRAGRRDHRSKRLIGDFDRFRAVPRRLLRFADDDGDEIAGEAYFIPRQQPMRRDERLRSGLYPQRRIRRSRRRDIVRDRAQAVGVQFVARKHRDDAAHAARAACVYAEDARMRMRRTHKGDMRHAGHTVIGGETALACHQSPVLLADDRPTYAGERIGNGVSVIVHCPDPTMFSQCLLACD
jgi:hypothetical protein